MQRFRRLRLLLKELRSEPAEDVVYDRGGNRNLRVVREATGLEACVGELLTSFSNGTPYCRASEMAVAKASISPEMTEPSFAIVRKISPGVPSSYMPTVM